MSDEIRPNLRDCPFCHAKGWDDEIIYFTKEVAVGHDCEFVVGYNVRCTGCGTSISDEYRDEVVRLWNGEDKKEEPEDEEPVEEVSKATPTERLAAREQHASTAPGPINCNTRLRFQNKAMPRTCARCGLGPCPFFTKDGTATFK